MERQGKLFDMTSPDMTPIIHAADPNVNAGDIKRLCRQSLEILARLRQGAATNMELAAITHRFSARIFDLRSAGYTVETIRGEGGLHTFKLTEEP